MKNKYLTIVTVQLPSMRKLPAEYEIQIYYEEKTLKCYYWYGESNYNLNITGIDGEITIDGKFTSQLIELIAGETDIEKIVDPY